MIKISLGQPPDQRPKRVPAFIAHASGVPCEKCGLNEGSGEVPRPDALCLCKDCFDAALAADERSRKGTLSPIVDRRLTTNQAPLDLRAIVRARMAARGLTQADLARLVAPRWEISDDSTEMRLMRWLKRRRDMTSDDLAKLFDVLGATGMTWT